MREKRQSIGICDHCLGPIELSHYTKRGPRLYCSVDCRNTANSRNGNAKRVRKLRASVAAGEWKNPADINPPDPENISAGISAARKREVAEGRWRNPALTKAARKKLSRPRKYTGALHSAIEKLGAGARVSDLTDEEAEVHRKHRRELRAKRRDESNAWYRRRYHERRAQMTEEELESQRQKWRDARERRANRNAEISETEV